MKTPPLFVLSFVASICCADTIVESPRSIPVIEDTDVVVVGGGFAATAAALEAKAAGADVFVVMPRQNPADDLITTRQLWLNADDESVDDPLVSAVYPLEDESGFTYTASVNAVSPHEDPGKTILKDGICNDASNNSVQYGELSNPCTSVTLTLTPSASSYSINAVKVYYFSGTSTAYGSYGTGGVAIQVNGAAVSGSSADESGDGYRVITYTFDNPISSANALDITCTTRDGCVRQLLGEIELVTDNVARATSTTPTSLFKALDKALGDAAIPYFTGAQVCDVLKDANGRLSGVVVANRNGRQAIKAKAVVDATEWGAVARKVAALRTGPANTDFTFVTTVDAEATLALPTGYAAVTVPSKITTVSVTPSDLRPKSAPESFSSVTYAVTKSFPLASSDYLLVNAIANEMKTDLWMPSVADRSEKPFFVPPESIVGQGATVTDWTSAANLPLTAFRPASSDDLWVAGMLADVSRPLAKRLSYIGVATVVGRRIGEAAAAAALSRTDAPSACTVGTVVTAGTGPEVREAIARPRHVGSVTEGDVPMLGAELPVLADVDVVVVGGGTAGGPAAIAAAKSGKRVLVAEWLFVMGGTTTESRIGRYWYGNLRGFTKKSVDVNTRGTEALGWILAETKSEWFRRQAIADGATVVLGAFAEGALVEGTDDDGRARVRGVVLVLPDGTRGVVKAKAVVDASGNADVVAAAGGETMFLSASEFAMQGSAASPHVIGQSYRNSDVGFLNTPDAGDLYTFALRARLGAPTTAWNLSHVNVGARERRRIVGDYVVTAVDELRNRTYPDTIMHGYSNFDMHGFTSSEMMMFCNHNKDLKFSADLPYRAVIPRRLEGIYSTGLSISADRDAMPIIRMQPDVQNQGYAVGIAAAMASDAGSVRGIDIKALQTQLIADGCLDSRVLTDAESAYDETTLDAEIAQLDLTFTNLPWIFAYPQESLPKLATALAAAEAGSTRQQALAVTLMLLGDDRGYDVVVEAFNAAEVTAGYNFKGLGNFGRQTSDFDVFLYALSRSANPKAAAVIARRMPEFIATDTARTIRPMSHFRMAALAALSLKSERIAAQFAALVARNGVIQGRAKTGAIEQVTYKGENDMDTERTQTIRDLVQLRARYRFGDAAAEGVLRTYLNDYRTIYASWAELALAQPPLGQSVGTWSDPDTLVIDLGTPLKPNAQSGTVSVSDATVKIIGVANSGEGTVNYELFPQGSFEPTDGHPLTESDKVDGRDKRGNAATSKFPADTWAFSANNLSGICVDGSYFMNNYGSGAIEANLPNGGGHAAFLACKNKIDQGSISQTFTVTEEAEYKLSFTYGSRYYGSKCYTVQIETELDGQIVNTCPETEAGQNYWSVNEFSLGVLSVGTHTLKFAAAKTESENWSLMDLVKIGKVIPGEEKLAFEDSQFRALNFSLGSDVSVELDLRGLDPVNIGSLWKDGSRIKGAVTSEKDFVTGEGTLLPRDKSPARLIVR